MITSDTCSTRRTDRHSLPRLSPGTYDHAGGLGEILKRVTMVESDIRTSSMRKCCAFLTMEDPSGFFVYDHLTHQPLASLGWRVVDIPWSKPVERWSQFDAVVIRSPWDYQSDPESFLATLDEIEAAGVRLFNSSRICRWNIDKIYLRDLAEQGVPTIPTLWLESFDRRQLDDQFKATEFSGPLVLKPTIGAGADNVIVLKRSDHSAWEQASQVFRDRPLMVQPFLGSIRSLGEYSLFYFAGKFSHAIIKIPAEGDFRVQEEHGGIIRSIRPSSEILSVAAKTLQAIDQTLLYARVDIVQLNDGSFAVIELELIEPSLYFSYDDQSPRRFAEALEELTR